MPPARRTVRLGPRGLSHHRQEALRMSRNSPSARRHRALVFLAHLVQYKKYGPLIGPKESHQPDYQWKGKEQ